MKIDLPIITGLPWRVPVVEAELVDVAPHLGWETFAVHRCLDHPRRWQVTHVETGFAGGPKCLTKERAIKMARKFYANMKPKTFRDAVDRACEAAPWIVDPKIQDIFDDALPSGGVDG